jgi:hypothetical protein
VQLRGSTSDHAGVHQYTIYEVFIYDEKLSYIVCLWPCILDYLIYCISLNVTLKRFQLTKVISPIHLNNIDDIFSYAAIVLF